MIDRYPYVQDNGSLEIYRGQRKIIISSRHVAYISDIGADFERYFGAVVPEKINGFEVVDYSVPKKHTIRPYGVTLDFTSLAENLPMMEQEYFYRYRPKSGDAVFDCGAYCGEMAFVFSYLVGPSGKVYAFEPDPENYVALIKNIEACGLKNVIPIKKGVWSKAATLFFNADGNLGASISRLSSGPCQIETISLADAYKEFGLTKLDFIKMDIEGAEVEAIDGSREFLRTHGTNMAIANHVIEGRQTYGAVEKTLAEIGYEIETGNPSGNPTWAGLITWAHKEGGLEV